MKKLIIVFFICFAQIMLANEPNNTQVMVIYNSNSTFGAEIANYYKQKRDIPDENIFSIACDTSEVVDTSYFRTNILYQLRDSINTRQTVKYRCLYIVLIKGFPLKIVCDLSKKCLDGGGDSSFFFIAFFKKSKSIDSRLCFLFDMNFNEYDGMYLGFGRHSSYYNKLTHFQNFHYFIDPIVATDNDTMSYLVCRIDAYTLQDCKNMIDRAFDSELSDNYNIVLDDDDFILSNAYTDTRDSLMKFNENFNNLYYDSTALPVIVPESTIVYSSFGRNATGGTTRYNNKTNTFLNGYWNNNIPNGAIINNGESLSGWSNYEYDGVNCNGHEDGTLDHNLVADFIKVGGTCGISYIYEPYTSGMAFNSITFKNYIYGYNFIESAYMGLKFINWKAVVIGDPLCRINYNCDINNDNLVDLFDVIIVYNNSITFSQGEFLECDLNGDGFIDLADIIRVYNRNTKFINY